VPLYPCTIEPHPLLETIEHKEIKKKTFISYLSIIPTYQICSSFLWHCFCCAGYKKLTMLCIVPAAQTYLPMIFQKKIKIKIKIDIHPVSNDYYFVYSEHHSLYYYYSSSSTTPASQCFHDPQ
jgi:hypothetical protein